MVFRKALMLFLCLQPAVLLAENYSEKRFGVRDMRYCEVVLSSGWMTFNVYNTMGLNDCPRDAWNEVDKGSIKRETGAISVILNGPRYWAMDGIENNPLVVKEEKKFKNIKMHRIATVHLNLLDVLGSFSGYREQRVERDTTFVYDAGKRIYELVGPNGQVYVMQSYSTQKQTLSKKDLINLGSKLSLPKGWKFKTGILKKRARLKTEDKEAYVLQDNLMNSYQRAPKDLL